MVDIKVGHDELEDEAEYTTYGICVDGHHNKIEIYGDEGLRDTIIRRLRAQPSGPLVKCA